MSRDSKLHLLAFLQVITLSVIYKRLSEHLKIHQIHTEAFKTPSTKRAMIITPVQLIKVDSCKITH